MTSSVRMLALGGGMAALLSGCAGTVPEPGPARSPINRAPSATATPTAPPVCEQPGLGVRAGPVDAAMGLRAMTLELVNCTDQSYTAHGYPALRVLDTERTPIDITVLQGTSAISTIAGYDSAPQPVEVPPGGSAAAVVVWRNTVTDATVPATNGSYLEVTPASDQPPRVVEPAGRIDLGTTGKLAVSPWTQPPGR